MGKRLSSHTPGTKHDAVDSFPRDLRRATVVVGDTGTSAEVLAFPPGRLVELGAEFQHHGMTWVVTSVQRDSGIAVAEPVAY
ncbi:MAG: hypothetical protein LJE93_16325 [Acidobacteria bacterium]|jgi:hypothetical protein|nr:hypothetical protein [Acidobacteriota bacterium]